jgi:hypothetical protein
MSNLSKTVELKELIENIKGIYESTNLLEILTDYERVLDNLDVYAYKNWGRGELAEGPISTRYWVTCKFIWPKKMPPDPLFIKRMQNNGIDVSVHTGDLKRPKHVESREDFKPGTFYPKLVKHPVWVVEISIPKHLTQEVEKGYMDLGGEKMDLSELDQAYDEDLDKQGAVNQGTEENFSG